MNIRHKQRTISTNAPLSSKYSTQILAIILKYPLPLVGTFQRFCRRTRKIVGSQRLALKYFEWLKCFEWLWMADAWYRCNVYSPKWFKSDSFAENKQKEMEKLCRHGVLSRWVPSVQSFSQHEHAYNGWVMVAAARNMHRWYTQSSNTVCTKLPVRH